jgi:hypothetical protein
MATVSGTASATGSGTLAGKVILGAATAGTGTGPGALAGVGVAIGQYPVHQL